MLFDDFLILTGINASYIDPDVRHKTNAINLYLLLIFDILYHFRGNKIQFIHRKKDKALRLADIKA